MAPVIFYLVLTGLTVIRSSAFAQTMSPNPLAPATRDANQWRPTWSPDGKEIAFSGFDEDGDYELFVVTLATGSVRRLTDNDVQDWRPKWSPDGTRIAFSSRRDGNGELYTIDPRSGQTTRITNTPEDEDRMAWSPDGRRLVYDVGAGGEWNLWTIDLESRETVQLTDDPGFEGYPDWSPDGTRIVFNSNLHDPEGGAAARELYVLKPSSGTRERLTHNNGNDQAAAWSPDGSRIAFFSFRDGNFDIYVIGVDGAGERRLTSDPEWDFMPAWSRDGAYIAFDSRRDGRRGIYIMRADGSEQRKITNLRMSPFIERARTEGVAGAVAAFRQAVRDGGQPDRYFLDTEVLALSRAVSDTAPVSALQLLDINILANPRSLLGWTSLGDMFLHLGLAHPARAAYQAALAIDPTNAPALAGIQRTNGS